jgi:hypothetical protein
MTTRVFATLVALLSICSGASPRAVVVVQQHRPAENHSCAIAIVGVDGRSFKSPQQSISLSPGHHILFLRVRDARGRLPQADAPLYEMFEAHHYTIDGELSPTGSFKLLFIDEDKRPRGAAVPKTR